MESRKDLLQKQITEALNANDTDLYSLLKSQWAHRFGVESLEELNNLDLDESTQALKKEDNQKVDESKNNILQDEEENSLRKDNEFFDTEEQHITKEYKESFVSTEIKSEDSLKSKSYKIDDNRNYKIQVIDNVTDAKSLPKVKPLIPLPPKPKYGFLVKWVRIKY